MNLLQPAYRDRRPLTLRVAMTALAFVASTFATAKGENAPRFRKGLWHFERTLELNKRSGDPDRKQVLLKQDMKRCVDPSVSMQETFRPVSVGNCHSTRPEHVASRYVFALRCDYMGPVRTTIDVQGDGAYTETNEVRVGQFPRTEKVVARRIAECP